MASRTTIITGSSAFPNHTQVERSTPRTRAGRSARSWQPRHSEPRRALPRGRQRCSEDGLVRFAGETIDSRRNDSRPAIRRESASWRNAGGRNPGVYDRPGDPTPRLAEASLTRNFGARSSTPRRSGPRRAQAEKHLAATGACCCRRTRRRADVRVAIGLERLDVLDARQDIDRAAGPRADASAYACRTGTIESASRESIAAAACSQAGAERIGFRSSVRMPKGRWATKRMPAEPARQVAVPGELGVEHGQVVGERVVDDFTRISGLRGLQQGRGAERVAEPADPVGT